MRQPREIAGPARGILRPPPEQASHEHHRILPRAELRELIAHFWWVSWALATPQRVETLSHPSVHLVFEESTGDEKAEVAGVPVSRFSRTLSGEGRVFGIKFRPAAFRALYDAPMHRLTGKVLPLRDVLADADDLARAVFATPAMDARVDLAEAFLMARRVVVSPALARMRDLVETIAVDSSLVRVGQLADLSKLDRRTLERRFRDGVGVTPKWVIRRYRIHEAAERLRRGEAIAALAAELGYADQAHFTRDFRASVGEAPAAFAKRSS